MQNIFNHFRAALLATLAVPVFCSAEVASPDSICGPDIVTIGDAWEKVQLQMSAVRQMLKKGDLQRFPQKNSAIMSHLRFMQQGAIMIYGKQRSKLDQSISVIENLLAEFSAASLEEQISINAENWAEAETVVKFIGSQFPEEALVPSASFAHLLPPVVPILHIQLEPVAEILPDRPMHIVFQLVRMKDLKPVGADDIITTHGAVLHALVCDRTLTDYQHEHPTPTGRPGEWEFTFTPRFNDVYRLWINAVPKETGREEFPVNTISIANPNLVPRPHTWNPEDTSKTAELSALLILDKTGKVAADRPTNGTVHISDKEGGPVNDLEAYMGAYAHIVGIAEDLHSVLHAHPDGGLAEITKLGGPELHFSMRPPRLGFYRLFVQVMRRGKVQTLTFGFRVP